MNREKIFQQIKTKESFLCIGLDSDYQKIPSHLRNKKEAVFEFNKEIIEQTHDTCVAYKINTAFYEAMGSKGWEILEKTAAYIKKKYPEIFLIADAKRGDIGNTAKMYAKSFFENMDFDAITVSPYMGSDSIHPFLEYNDKWVIILGLTSNQGASDFQYFYSDKQNQTLYEKVISTSCKWGSYDNTMFVAGATKAQEIKEIRKMIPYHFLLVPGIGSQGGSLEQVAEFGLNKKCGLIVNSSRSIIFSDHSENFATSARKKAIEIKESMKIILDKSL